MGAPMSAQEALEKLHAAQWALEQEVRRYTEFLDGEAFDAFHALLEAVRRARVELHEALADE